MGKFFSTIVGTLILSQALTGQQWTPWGGATGEIATDTYYTRVEGDLFVPLWQCQDSRILFTYLRAAKYGKHHLTDGSAALGFRCLAGRTIMGFNVGYDGLLSRNANWFNYVDVGGELFTSCLDLHLNGRIPVGKRHHRFGAGPQAIETFLVDDEVRLLTRLRSEERSEWTLDGEVGYRFCLFGRCGPTGRAYIGGQYVGDSTRFTEANGALVGLEFYNGELHCVPGQLQITAGARYITNFERNNEGVFYLSLRKAFGSSCFDCCACNAMLLSRMDDPIQRRFAPGVIRRPGALLEEALTTLEYPVDGIWVSYEADSDDLQTQIDKALANGGTNTMIFADGDYSAENILLNSAQVLAGGNAFLASRGKTSGAPVTWGAWGNFTTDAAVITGTDEMQSVLTMETGSSLDTATLVGGNVGIFNAPDATDLTIRNATVVAAVNTAESFAIQLVNADRSLVQNTEILGGAFDRGGYLVSESADVKLLNIRSSNAGDESQAGRGNVINESTNTLVDGMFSDDDGGNSWTVVSSDGTVMRDFEIVSTDFDGISSGFSSDTTIENGVITGSTSDAIFFGTNGGFNFIRNMTINGYSSNGIQIGGSGTSSASYVGITENMAISNVLVTSNDAANNNAGILIQNNVNGGVERVSLNSATIIGAGVTSNNDGIEIRSQDGFSTIEVSGSGNSISNVENDCLLLPAVPAGELDGNILFNGGQKCPPSP